MSLLKRQRVDQWKLIHKSLGYCCFHDCWLIKKDQIYPRFKMEHQLHTSCDFTLGVRSVRQSLQKQTNSLQR